MWVTVECTGKILTGKNANEENCGAELTVNLAKREPGGWAGKQCVICGTPYSTELLTGLRDLSSASISVRDSKANVWFKVRATNIS